ncbi:band 7 domain-containing protein [Dacryopinax primogenitus]|uniref:Band 7 domain-containing protein n=1 Tax=Dacryopinax primogenitus (strain DJM 731) TaxID=1858805 RepID=M5G666_DACPD|nr:band 7 domain-containing protein [Dacryopinax primogenitus]EJU05751.1 band 7 domain-containing protein [Dacryopinax primogenitus]
MDACSDFDGTTVLGANDDARLSEKSTRPNKGKSVTPESSVPRNTLVPFVNTVEYLDQHRPFFVRCGEDGLIPALHKLNDQIVSAGHRSIMCKIQPMDFGREISPGQIGLVNRAGWPELLMQPGKYPGFPFRNWWARKFDGRQGVSDTVLQFQGLTAVQVSQNQAAVVSDPQNQIFVIRSGGFVALALQGTYDVLAVVDQTHLAKAITDKMTNQVLGYMQEVRMASTLGAKRNSQEYVVATFLNIPANNCAILQRGDELQQIPAGQHVITNPNVTFRSLFTRGECQIEMPAKDIMTKDQVPVSLTIYLKWQLEEPLKLTQHGYVSPYDALRDKSQSILTQIVAHLEYASMVKSRTLGPELEEHPGDSTAFLDSLRSRAMDDLHLAALEYGIVLKDLAVIDRKFKGEIAQTMDHLTRRALEAQVEAANVDRENSNRVKKEEGQLQVAQVQSKQRQAIADADAYTVVAKARADAQASAIAADARANAIRIQAAAEADAIKIKAQAVAEIRDEFAKEVELRRLEIQRVAAYGNRTVFVPASDPGMANNMTNALSVGMAAGMGRDAAPQ